MKVTIVVKMTAEESNDMIDYELLEEMKANDFKGWKDDVIKQLVDDMCDEAEILSFEFEE